jgi:hypothetical protein
MKAHSLTDRYDNSSSPLCEAGYFRRIVVFFYLLLGTVLSTFEAGGRLYFNVQGVIKSAANLLHGLVYSFLPLLTRWEGGDRRRKITVM